MRKKLTLQHL